MIILTFSVLFFNIILAAAKAFLKHRKVFFAFGMFILKKV